VTTAPVPLFTSASRTVASLAVAFAFVALHAATPGEAEAETSFNVYIVQPGDSLSAIALEAGTTVEALIEFNQIDDPDRVLPGRPLIYATANSPARPEIRAPEPPTQTYVVAEGDTLTGIAALVGSDLPTIARLNNMAEHNIIPIGMPLTVPKRIAPPAPRIQVQHVVQEGETASGIADRYGVSLTALGPMNQLRDPNRIHVGMVLDIPARALPVPPPHIVSALGHAAADYNLDPYVLLGLAYLESGWQMDAISSAGAIGVMQLMPDTARWAVRDLVLPATNWPHSVVDNIRVGAAFFAYLMMLSEGDVAAALAGYYQGWTSVATEGRYEETEQYIDDVLALIERFRAMPAIF
jgi:LysM repeat protein